MYHTPRIDQVALISGGGSGHEPSFAGLVGHGLLSAAVAGTIFASPSTAQIQNAILERVDGRQGVLVIIMNYTVRHGEDLASLVLLATDHWHPG